MVNNCRRRILHPLSKTEQSPTFSSSFIHYCHFNIYSRKRKTGIKKYYRNNYTEAFYVFPLKLYLELPSNIPIHSWVKYLEQGKRIMQNDWKKNYEKDQKNLISAFPFFLTDTAKVLFLEKRMDSMLFTNISTQF